MKRQPGLRRLAAVSALLAVVLLAAGLASTPVAAQDGYTPGTAVAEAQPFGVTVVYNNANIGLGFAAASARFSSTSAKATASFFRFGLAELVASLQICGTHPVPPGAMPAPVTASTDDTPGETSEHSGGTDQQAAFAAGHARATPGADAQADTTAVGFELPGMVSMTGGEAHARATSDPATQTRTATADTVADLSLLAGAVQLTGIRFHLDQGSVGADHRTTERTQNSSFTIGGLKLAGLPVPLPGPPENAVATLNSLTRSLGLEFHMPQVIADGSHGYRLTPFTIVLGGSPVYGDLVRQLTNSAATTQILAALQAGLFDSTSCDQLFGLMKSAPQLNSMYNAIGLAAPILVAVIASALSGGGQINLEVGGARTNIDDTYYPAPTFTRAAPPALPPSTATVAPAVNSAAVAPPSATVSAGAAVPGSPASAARAPVNTTSQCRTSSPAERPGCWQGRATAGALAAIVLAGGLLVVDEVRRRRRVLAVLSEESP